MPKDLESLLSDARKKTDAERDAAAQSQSLMRLDDECTRLVAARDEAASVAARGVGWLGRLSARRRERATAAEASLAKLDASVASSERDRTAGRALLVELREAAQGAELARALLGAEMRRRTDRISHDDPDRERLTVLDQRREQALRRRGVAKALGESARTGLQLGANAVRADDGTDVFYQEVRVLSLKWEDLDDHIIPNALILRHLLRDHLEVVWTISRELPDTELASELNSLITKFAETDADVWLHRVRVAVERAIEIASEEQSDTERTLIDIDNQRLQLLQ